MTGTRKFDHITPVLHQLHWLPVRQQITFKLTMITYKCLHGLALSYLADVCTPVSAIIDRWQLQSTDSGTLVVPPTKSTIGWRNFDCVGPGDMEQPSRRTADVNSVHRNIRKKTQKSSLWLLMPLRTLSNWCYINICIHSFNSNHQFSIS